MIDYIPSEAAFDAVYRQFCASSDETEAALKAVIDEIKQIPFADVRPVVRGKWEKGTGENGVTTSLFCSVCHYENTHWREWNYCPNCGADMREE